MSFTAYSQYTLLWADEFDSTALDASKWAPEVGGWGWGNNELQYYTNGDNLMFTGDELIIEAREEQFIANDYTSGKIYTKNLFEIRHGKIEARIKVPAGQGLWPAFWMLGTNIDQVSWPYCGEIDIMEHVNNAPEIHGTAHWDNNGHVYYGGSATTDATQFHVYSIEWDSTEIRWYLDGNQYHIMNIANDINGTGELNNHMYLILNLAVGGNWPGSPNASTVFPAQLVIDYVRVYKTDLEIGVEEQQQNTISLYPNPTTENVVVTVDEAQQMRIYSIDGLLVDSEQLVLGDNTIDLSDYPKGIYLVTCETSDGRLTNSRLVVQ